MCIPLAKDPFNVLWSITCNDIGELQSTPTPRLTGYGPPVCKDTSNNSWNYSIDNQGRIVTTTNVTVSNTGYALSAFPSGLGWETSIDGPSARLTNTQPSLSVFPDLPTYPLDITMSTWPKTAQVFCNTCGNANVTLSADMSGWCCTCNAFVLPDDTTVLQFLDE